MSTLPRGFRMIGLAASLALIVTSTPGFAYGTGDDEPVRRGSGDDGSSSQNRGSGNDGSGSDFGRGSGSDFGRGSGSDSQYGSGNDSQYGSGGTQQGTGDDIVYRDSYRNGSSYLRNGRYQDAIENLRRADGLRSQYGSGNDNYQIRADLASAYLWRGIEIYRDASWSSDYDRAIEYLRAVQIELTSDDMLVRYLGGSSSAMRKLNLKHYYLGMCYYEKGAYFDWVDNDGAARMYLSLVTKSREQWRHFRDPKILIEQKVLYADAKYVLAQLLEKRDKQAAAANYKEAYKTYKELKNAGLSDLVYYWGEGTSGFSYNQLTFSTKRKKRESINQKLSNMEESMVAMAQAANNRANYGEARELADYVFTNSSSQSTRSKALDVKIQSYEKSNDWRRAIDTRKRYRNDFGYHKHTVGMGRGYQELGDTRQARQLFGEVVNASGADRAYKTEAADGLASMDLPLIDAKISAGDLNGAIQKIRSSLDSYPTSKKDEFTRRAADIVDRYIAGGDTEAALRLIEEFTTKYSSGNNSALDAKKVSILEKGDDFDAYKRAVLDFDSKYARSDSGSANALLIQLIEKWESNKNPDESAIQALVDKLAGRGNSFGKARHQQAAQRELDRVMGLGNKADIRAGLLQIGMSPSASFATASQVLASAKSKYLAQYASPWYYETKRRNAAAPAIDSGFSESDSEEILRVKHEKWRDLHKKVADKELSAYARMNGAQLEALFASGSDGNKAYTALASRIDAEQAAFETWKNSGRFSGRGKKKKAYQALVKKSPTKASLEATFFSKAYTAPVVSSRRGGTRSQETPGFDGVDR